MAVSTLQLINLAVLFLALVHSVTSSTSQFAVGLTDPIPTFVTSEYVVVDRIVTLFCLKTCGGECEACCAYTPDVPDVYQTTAYLDICKGRLGLERAICLELKSNLEFICTKSSYKYKTDQPVQEFKLEKVFNSKKRDVEQLTTKPALGISTTNPIPLSISKRRNVDTWKDNDNKKDQYKNDDDKNNTVYAPPPNADPKAYFNSADPSFDYEYYFGSNSTKVPYQEVFVCANKLGATHYRPINPSTNSSTNSSVPKAFWQYTSSNSKSQGKDRPPRDNDQYGHDDRKHDYHRDRQYQKDDYRDDHHNDHDEKRNRGKHERNGHGYSPKIHPKYAFDPDQDFYTFKNEYYEIFGNRERKYN